MKGIMHVIIGTPNSTRRSTLEQAIENTQGKVISNFLLPVELDFINLPGTHWEWIDHEFRIKESSKDNIDEWFLFLSNKIDIADQFESLKKLIDQKEELEIGRIVTFINADYLNNEKIQFQDWLDTCAHFSDAFCFSNRTNKNAHGLSSLVERYKNMRYPMETFILAKSKTPPIDRILCPVPRRITHIFDPVDILESEDSLDNDPFLKKHPNGKRIKIANLPNWNKS
ncbi:hypothetical protein N9N13_05170 [Opitutales bacterium]|nr:hypothetical protein [Opitutales bacterium]